MPLNNTIHISKNQSSFWVTVPHDTTLRIEGLEMDAIFKLSRGQSQSPQIIVVKNHDGFGAATTGYFFNSTDAYLRTRRIVDEYHGCARRICALDRTKHTLFDKVKINSAIDR